MYLSALSDGNEKKKSIQKETKRIIEDYFAQVYVNKLEN